MVLPSSGTLTFLLRDKDPARCQKGTLSGNAAVSLSEVVERATDKAASLSAALPGLVGPTGLLDGGQS